MGKVETALKYGLSEDEWKVPTYIHEGLLWLADSAPLPLPSAEQHANGGVAHGD
jgi:putative ATP-dependent endonuclease of OLD family